MKSVLLYTPNQSNYYLSLSLEHSVAVSNTRMILIERLSASAILKFFLSSLLLLLSTLFLLLLTLSLLFYYNYYCNYSNGYYRYHLYYYNYYYCYYYYNYCPYYLTELLICNFCA